LLGELARSTGLSVEGVALALERSLEWDASPEEIDALPAHAKEEPLVAVILSANVFVGALRALALARAASSRVIVRPSRRDPFFARPLVAAATDPVFVLDDAFDVATIPEGEIHVYGKDETIAAVRAKARPSVRVRGHGAGFGVAWMPREIDVQAF